MRLCKVSAFNGYFSGTAVELLIKAKWFSLTNLQRRRLLVSPLSLFQISQPSFLEGKVIVLLITKALSVAIERFRNETLRVFGVLEIQLSGKYTGQPHEFLVGGGLGKYSVADIGTWTWVKGWEFGGLTEKDMQAFPHLMKWIARIAERPAVKRGIGEKYQK